MKYPAQELSFLWKHVPDTREAPHMETMFLHRLETVALLHIQTLSNIRAR